MRVCICEWPLLCDGSGRIPCMGCGGDGPCVCAACDGAGERECDGCEFCGLEPEDIWQAEEADSTACFSTTNEATK